MLSRGDVRQGDVEWCHCSGLDGIGEVLGPRSRWREEEFGSPSRRVGLRGEMIFAGLVCDCADRR
jgi:hypothetical protein